MRTILYLNAVGEISGAERSLLTMLDALDRSRWVPVVAAPEGALLHEVERRGIRAVPVALTALSRPRTPVDTLSLLHALRDGRREVARVAGEVMPDLLHANSTPAMLYALGVKSCPLIWQVRDLVRLGMIGRMLFRHAARVVVISVPVWKEIKQYQRGNERKIVCIQPAVDTERFHPVEDKCALRQDLGLPVDVPLLGMVAQFVPWKRHHLFLDALDLLTDRPWHAVLAGADFGRDAAYVDSIRERISRPPLAGRVSWLPWQDDPARLIAAFDLCVLTSKQEPFGRIVIEAMACGVPVVAVNEGAVSDIVLPELNGILTSADPAAIAAALTTLIDDLPMYEWCVTTARKWMIQRFGLQQHSEELTRLYENILNVDTHTLS